MDDRPTLIERPTRWEVPFGEDMCDKYVDALMLISPFANMDESRFSPACSLRDIMRNDCRIVEYEDGDIVTREGDYGNSAFLVLQGEVSVTLQSLPSSILGHQESKKPSVMRALAQLWNRRSIPEVRDQSNTASQKQTGQRESDTGRRIFLQDVPGVLDKFNTLTLGRGELFGEVAALARTPRTSTVFAKRKTMLLEMRWQGLRDIMKRAPEFKAHIDDLYRQNSLMAHLRETPVLTGLPPEVFSHIADAAEFETYGSFDWHHQFDLETTHDSAERLASEPLIAEEGHYPNGLLLIRSGFARLSRKKGNGHQTSAYLGKGQYYGLGELTHNWQSDTTIPFQQSLRAVGYVDVIRIPTTIVEQLVLPKLNRLQLAGLVKEAIPEEKQPEATKSLPAPSRVETGLLEFLVESRLMNGTQTMMLDLERCTRCDDCVRACESAHDGNPRFIRHGLRYGNYMFANACMHCADPVCMIGCPTGAIARDATTGNVLINDETCIGCATCANSCPYENIRMVEIRDKKGNVVIDSDNRQPVQKATKCDLCSDQLTGPACQNACPHDALIRLDMRDMGALGSFVNR